MPIEKVREKGREKERVWERKRYIEEERKRENERESEIVSSFLRFLWNNEFVAAGFHHFQPPPFPKQNLCK